MIFRFKRFLGEALPFCDGFLCVKPPKGKTFRQLIKESTALGLSHYGLYTHNGKFAVLGQLVIAIRLK